MQQIIINLTQHAATPEQQEAGVIELREKERLVKLLTFDDLPSREEISDRAHRIASLAFDEIEYQIENLELKNEFVCCSAMIGGAPWPMGVLEETLMGMDIKPLYAFSKRVVTEEVKENAAIIKTAVFKHLGFVEV